MTTQKADALMTAERQRQINVEGWSADHDDAHDGGELLRAALCYYREATGDNEYTATGRPLAWPWDDKWWKPKGAQADLIRAGALCLAERARLNRRNHPVRHVELKYEMIAKALTELLNDGVSETKGPRA